MHRFSKNLPYIKLFNENDSIMKSKMLKTISLVDGVKILKLSFTIDQF